MNKPIKHCVDCKHYIPSDPPHFGRCRKRVFQYETDDQMRKWLVAGVGDTPPNLQPQFDYCSTARMEECDCGPDAKLFEPKEAA